MIRKEDWFGSRESRIAPRKDVRGAFCGTVVRRSMGLGRAALAIAILAACGRASKPTAPGCCEKSGPGWTDDAGADSGVPDATAAAKPPTRFRGEEGCTRDFKTSNEASRDLGELERLCAQGLSPVLAPAEMTQSSGSQPVEVAFRVAGSTACLRAGAVGIAPGQVISLESAKGKVLAAVTSVEAIAVVPVDGTVCVREPGTYRLDVKPAATSTEARTLSVQVWQASRE